MKVSFRCKRSGNVVSFVHAQDIDWMRKEAEYEELKDESKTESNAQINAKQEVGKSLVDNPDEGYNAEDAGQKDAKVLKRRGRPRNIEQDVI